MRPFFELSYPQTGNRGAFAPQFSDDRPTIAVLVAGAKQAVAVPSGARYVSFASEDGRPFYAWHGTSAADALAIPAASTSTDTGEPNPALRRIPDGATHILLISVYATKVALTFSS